MSWGSCLLHLLKLGVLDAVCENGVEALADSQLMLLQLAERTNHKRVLEIGGDGRFEQRHLIVAELRHALVEETADAGVSGLAPILHNTQYV